MADRLIELARLARRGDRPTLEALLREAVGFLHALARARMGDGADAESVTADALTRIAGGLPRLRDPQAFPHWAYRILQRCIARRGGRMRGSVDPQTVSLADGALGPTDTAIHTERKQVVQAAIAALPPRLREPVLLHFVCGLGYREIAKVLGTGLSTVSRRMTKALASLKPRLGESR